MSDIREALMKLDASNENHWTADKLPRLETVKFNASDQSITREQVNEAAPGLTQQTAAAYWMAAPAFAPATDEPAEPVAQAGTAGAVATEMLPSGETAAPHLAGAGAGPQAEASQAGEGTQTSEAPEGAQGGGDNGDGEAKQGEVEDRSAAGTDEIASVEAELEALQSHMETGRRAIDEMKAELDKLAVREDELLNRRNVLTKDDKPVATAIAAYLASQRKLLEARRSRKELIAESGLDLKELANGLKSPIDSAMARKNGRGGQRPTRV